MSHHSVSSEHIGFTDSYMAYIVLLTLLGFLCIVSLQVSNCQPCACET